MENRRGNTKEERDIIWANLRKGIQEIYEGKQISKPRYMELYTYVFDYCKNKQRSLVGLELYNRLKDFLHEHVSTIFQQGELLGEEEMVAFYSTKFQKFKIMSKVLNDICGNLNRHWLRRELDEGNKNFFEILQMALIIWKDTLSEKLRRKVTDFVMKSVGGVRNGENINPEMVSDLMVWYIGLGVSEVDENGMPTVNGSDALKQLQGRALEIHRELFEADILMESKQIYANVNKELEMLLQNSVVDYIKNADQYVVEEQRILELYLHPSTLEKFMQYCKTDLIDKHFDVLKMELKKLLDGNKIDELEVVLKFFKRLKALSDLIEKSLRDRTLTAIEQLDETERLDPNIYVSTILEVRNQFNNILPDVFTTDPDFLVGQNKACVKFVNDNAVTRAVGSSQKSAELLARYSHIIQESNKNIGDNDLETKMNQAMIVFNYIEDKDVFERFYRNLLAIRLVSRMLANEEAEKVMIGKLKTACDAQYTTKLDEILKDIDVSNDLNNQFKSYLERKKIKIPLDLQIQVLASGTWPFSSNVELDLPLEMANIMNRFNDFYKLNYNERKLVWLFNHSKADIITNCYPNRYILQASTFQTVILWMFNSYDSYIIEELVDATKMKTEIITQVVESLCKAGLLTKPRAHENLTAETIISFNGNYKNKNFKVNINAPLITEMKQEHVQTNQAIEENRIHLIQAAIVRIMKSRKFCKHNDLIAEVLRELSLRFYPRVQMIEKYIDLLIENDYIEPTEGQTDTYSYLD